MPEHPILMSGEMVLAYLWGRKTETRRVVHPQPTQVMDGRCFLDGYGDGGPGSRDRIIHCPYGKPGDRLWFREKWRYGWTPYAGQGIVFAADDAYISHNEGEEGALIWLKYGGDCHKEPWRPSIHLPRWAARCRPTVRAIRVERLQNITDEGCIAEGIEPVGNGWRDYTLDQGRPGHGTWLKPRNSYRTLWDSINRRRQGARWQENPWVWVVQFSIHTPGTPD